ncbi:MAG: thioredoxin domain-containing protein, partial [Promethearchaeota archaeon]
EKRIHPHKDDKILVDWNGLMIAALAKGAYVFNEKKYLDTAQKATDFLISLLRSTNGRLLHRYREGVGEINAYLTDYAFLVWGLIELYEATFDIYYLKTALELHEIQLKHFWDNNIGGFFFTADDSEELLTRQKEIYDGAIPSGNSVAMLNLLRLSYFTGNHELEKKADIIGRVFAEKLESTPVAYTNFMVAADFAIGPTYSLVIAGNTNNNDTNQMLTTVRDEYIPNKILMQRKTEQNPPDIDDFSNFVQFFDNLEEVATAYVCINKTCKPPTHDLNQMIEFLKSDWSK